MNKEESKENLKKQVRKILNKFPKKTRYNTDDIYEFLTKFVNQERNHFNLIENRWRETRDHNLKANAEISSLRQLLEERDTEIEKLHMIIKTQDLEIQKLTKVNDNQDKHQKKLYEYLDKTAEILKNSQKELIKTKSKNKLTIGDYIADGMSKMDKSTKERLK